MRFVVRVIGSRRITEGRSIRQALASPLFGINVHASVRGLFWRAMASAVAGESIMRNIRNIVWTTGLALIVALSVACASGGQRSISQVQSNPGRYVDRTVTVEGVVTTSWGIPMVPFKIYRVSDGSGEMLVISDNGRVPAKNARVRVRGEVEEFALIGGRSFGLHIREKGIKYM